MEEKQKKIIVALDFSNPSMAALDVGVKFAEIHGSELVLLHVLEKVSPVYEFLIDNTLMDRKREHADKKLDEVLESLQGKGLEVSKMFEEGKPHEEIAKAAEHVFAELIVMGLHGWNHGTGDPAGSTVNKVIRNTSIPVVTVKDGVKVTEFNKLLVPVDPSFGIRELRHELHRYHDSFNPEVTICCVHTGDDYEMTDITTHLDRQKKTLEKQGIKNVKTKTLGGKVVSETIIQEAQEGGYDMVWMETHGRTGLTNLFMGSITEEVLSHVAIPVLVLKPDREPVYRSIGHHNLPI